MGTRLLLGLKPYMHVKTMNTYFNLNKRGVTSSNLVPFFNLSYKNMYLNFFSLRYLGKKMSKMNFSFKIICVGLNVGFSSQFLIYFTSVCYIM